MIIYIFLLITFASIFPSDKHNKYAESISFANGGAAGFIIGTGFLVQEWKWQCGVYEKVDIDSIVTDEHGKSGATFFYFPEQRIRARLWQHNALIGGLSLTTGYVYPFMTPQAARAMRIRCQINTAGVVEQAVVPTVICGSVQNFLDTHYPTMSPGVRDSVAITTSFVIPRAAVKYGVSAERVLLHAFLLYLSGDLKNRYRHCRLLRPVTHAFESAAQSVPLIQSVGTVFDFQPGPLTLCTPHDRDGKVVNFEQELYSAIVPTLIHTGVGLGVQVSLDLLGSTTIGDQLNQTINVQLQPLVGEDQVETVKNVGKQLLIAGTTVATIRAIKKQECTLL